MNNLSVVDNILWKNVSNGDIDSNSDLYDGTLGLNMVRIKPNWSLWMADDKDTKKMLDRTITGILISNFDYSLTSEWSQLATPFDSGLGQILGGVGTAAGGGELGSVFKSKKFWKKSGYVDIQPQIRVIDVHGDGLPLHVVRYLMMWATAVSTVEDELIKKGIDALKKGADKVIDVIENLIASNDNEGLKTFLSTLKKGEESLENSTGGKIIKRATTNAYKDYSDLYTMRNTPPTLIVEIGQIFKHEDMILNQVEVSFSNERGNAGPLYADITLHLSSRKIIGTIKDIGLFNNRAGNIAIRDKDGNILKTNIDSLKDFKDANPTQSYTFEPIVITA